MDESLYNSLVPRELEAERLLAALLPGPLLHTPIPGWRSRGSSYPRKSGHVRVMLKSVRRRAAPELSLKNKDESDGNE